MDPESAIRILVIFGLGKIPEAGEIIAGVVGYLWPETKEDVWGQIKDQVEALIDKKLADFEYQQVKEDLDGLSNVLQDYTKAIKHSKSSPTYISEKYNVALGHFESLQPHFMSRGYEVLLLPLLAEMANLHLALLRDGVIFGSSWGWTPEDVEDEKTRLTGSIKCYGDWVKKWYQTGYDQIPIPQTGKDPRARGADIPMLQWIARNKYIRFMTLKVQDLAFYWPYFEPGSGTVPKLTREIFSDPEGNAYDHPIKIDISTKQRLSALSIWGWDRIDAVQQAFGGGPLGPRMGNERRPDGHGGWSGGSDNPPHGWNGSVSAGNPVVEVSGISGDVIDAMRLKFKDGTETNLCGGNYPPPYPHNFDWKFDGQILSQIYIPGVSSFYGSAESIFFGFRFEDSY